MKYKTYNWIFSLSALMVLIGYLSSNLLSDLILVYTSILFGMVMVGLNWFFLKIKNLKEGIKLFGFEFYNLEKVILGFWFLLYLFILDSGLPKTTVHLLAYGLFTLGLLNSFRVRKVR